MAQAHKTMQEQTGKFIENAISQALTKWKIQLSQHLLL